MAAGKFGADDVGVLAEGSDRVGVKVQAGGDNGEVVDHDWDRTSVRYLNAGKPTMGLMKKSEKRSRRTSR